MTNTWAMLQQTVWEEKNHYSEKKIVVHSFTLTKYA